MVWTTVFLGLYVACIYKLGIKSLRHVYVIILNLCKVDKCRLYNLYTRQWCRCCNVNVSPLRSSNQHNISFQSTETANTVLWLFVYVLAKPYRYQYCFFLLSKRLNGVHLITCTSFHINTRIIKYISRKRHNIINLFDTVSSNIYCLYQVNGIYMRIGLDQIELLRIWQVTIFFSNKS